MATFTTEFISRQIIGTTPGTDLQELCSTLIAKVPRIGILGLALRALHLVTPGNLKKSEKGGREKGGRP